MPGGLWTDHMAFSFFLLSFFSKGFISMYVSTSIKYNLCTSMCMYFLKYVTCDTDREF